MIERTCGEHGGMGNRGSYGCYVCKLETEVEKLKDHRDQHRHWLLSLEKRLEELTPKPRHGNEEGENG